MALTAILAAALYAALPVVESVHSLSAHGQTAHADGSASDHGCHHGHAPADPGDPTPPFDDRDDCRLCLALQLARHAPPASAAPAASFDREPCLPAVGGPGVELVPLAPVLTSASPRGPPRC